MSMSTLRFKHWLGMLGLTTEDRKLPVNEYTIDGDGYPIMEEGIGMIGTICVSGLMNDEEDHACIVDAIKNFISHPDNNRIPYPLFSRIIRSPRELYYRYTVQWTLHKREPVF